MSKIGLLLFLLTTPFVGLSQQFEQQPLLDNYYGREAEFGDFDRDGDLDILMFYTFEDPYGEGYTRILENVENEFIELELGFPRVEYFGSRRNGSVNWVDYNNDGYLDVFLVIGQTSSVETKLFKNNRDKTFTEIRLNLNDLVIGSCGPSWSDFDNDGDLDVTIFGAIRYREYTIKIYENDSEKNEFSPLEFNFGKSILKSRSPWADFNNDGFLDLLVNEPIDNIQSILAVYKNNGDKTFTKIVFPNLTGLDQDVLNQTGDMRWGDYNNDGFIDVLISGLRTGSFDRGITKLYKNNGDESFTEISMDGVYPTDGDVSIEWGDYDCDGDLDILQTGSGSTSPTQSFRRTNLFINNNGSFQDSELSFLRGHQAGMSTGGDYNGDNKLDILVLGEESFAHHKISLFENITAHNNTPPRPPESLTTKIENDNLVLTWTSGSDAETPVNGLRYNVYIVHEQDTTVQPSSLPTGKRIIVNNGNAQNNKFFKLKNPKPGTYKWGVQSIDQSFIGSVFSKEGEIEVSTVTSISDDFLYNEKIKAFPNPFDSQINISQEQLKSLVSITLMDMQGREIYKVEISQLPHMIATDHLKKGIYLLTIMSGSNVTVTKVVKN